MSVLDGPGEGTWSVFAEKVVEQRDQAREELNDALSALEQVEDDRQERQRLRQQVLLLRAALRDRGCRPIANGNDCAGCKALAATEEP